MNREQTTGSVLSYDLENSEKENWKINKNGKTR